MESERLTAEGTMDYREFLDELYALLNTVWGENWGRMVMRRPNVSDGKNIDVPIIVYSLKEKKPGIIGKSTHEIKPRERQQFLTKNKETGEDEFIRIMGRVVDCTIEFVLYEQNSAKVQELSENFTKTMDKYKGLLMSKGMKNMWFLKESEGSLNENGNDNISARKVEYLVQLEDLYQENLTMIKKIEILVDIEKSRYKKEGKLPSQQST